MTDRRNPYAPPTAHVADHVDQPTTQGDETFIPYGRSVSPGRGAGWIGDAWRVFRARLGKWLLTVLVIGAIYVVAAFIPLSSFVVPFFWPFVSAGLAKGADRQRRTGTFEVGTLFDGYERQWPRLLTIGGIGLLSLFLAFGLMTLTAGSTLAAQATFGIGGQPNTTQLMTSGYWLALLLYVLLHLPITAATYFAPPLIVLHDQRVGTAMKMSFVGALKNILPGIVNGLCAVGLFILSAIPLGLGFLVWIPVMMICFYTVYRDVFFEPRN